MTSQSMLGFPGGVVGFPSRWEGQDWPLFIGEARVVLWAYPYQDFGSIIVRKSRLIS